MANRIDDLKIIYHGSCALLDFGESRTAGKYIKIRLSDLDNDGDPLAPFRGMDTPTLKKSGHIMNITLSQGDIIPEEEPPKKGPHGKEASKLHQSGFFRTPAIWKALGTDEQYREWIQKQNCMCCGNQDWVEDLGEGRCESAHVRRSGEAGVSYKPAYSCVPLCNAHHSLQHKEGEATVFMENPKMKNRMREQEISTKEFLEAAKDWFDAGKLHYLELWAHEQLCATFGIKSLTLLEPDALIAWAVEAKVDNYLPRNYGGPA